MHRLTLRSRLVLANVLVFLVTFAVLAAVITSDLVRHLNEQVDAELARQSESAMHHASFERGKLRLGERDEQSAAALGAYGFVRLLDAKGQIADGVGAYQAPPFATGVLGNYEREGGATVRNGSDPPLRVYTRPLVDDDRVVGYVQVGTVPTEVNEVAAQIRRSLLIATPLALLGAGLAALWAARKALRPLTEMTRSAAEISADSLSERRLPVPLPNDEVRALALDFNAMLDGLAAAFARQRRFTADASHELRTPVTAILGQAEVALSRPRTPESYQETLMRIRGDAERMQRLIGRLLTLARADRSRTLIMPKQADVAELLRALIHALAAEAQDKGIDLRLEGPAHVLLVTDVDTLTQVLLNLLENALAYTEHGEVLLVLNIDAGTLRIDVCDSGPGIAPADLPLIFEPFYRADPSRQRRSGGMGLGLALAQELTQLLGGALTVANRTQGGAVFTVTLPRQAMLPSFGESSVGGSQGAKPT